VVTSFSPLYLREIFGWLDVSLSAKTDGNGSVASFTVVISFPFPPVLYF
jgi:hypothetical protein